MMIIIVSRNTLGHVIRISPHTRTAISPHYHSIIANPGAVKTIAKVTGIVIGNTVHSNRHSQASNR